MTETEDPGHARLPFRVFRQGAGGAIVSVLLTGVAGFIGSHVAEALLANGHQVIGLDDLSGGAEENIPKGVRFYHGSILDAGLLATLFSRHRVRFVYHLAGYAAEGLSHYIRVFNYSNNLVGSMMVLNQAIHAGVECFVFTSSIAVYGLTGAPWREETTPRPEDPYGIAKYAVELDLQSARRTHGLNYIIFRPHNVYGERQNLGDRYRNVIGIFMNQLLQDQPMTIFGDGSQTRAFSYIGDVAPLLASALSVPAAYNQIFNVGDDDPVTVNELATLVAGALGKPRQVVHLPSLPEALHATADHSKLASGFHYRPGWNLPAGIGRMAAWARSHGPCQPTRVPNIELRKNLPEVWSQAP